MKGFTLIETLIYIALFTLIIFGSVVTAYNLVQGSDMLNKKTVTEEEGNFVLRKLDWAMTGLTSISIGGSNCTQTLTANKINFGTIDFRTTGGATNKIEMQENGGGYFPITTINASTTCLKFSQISSDPIGITVTATINNIDFVLTKYARE